jgi:DNA repair protein RadC
MTQVQSSNPVEYVVDAQPTVWTDDFILARAWEIVNSRARVPGKQFTSPDEVKRYLIMANAQEADQFRERFGVLFLDSHHALIEFQVMFTGTLTASSRSPLLFVCQMLIPCLGHPKRDSQPLQACQSSVVRLCRLYIQTLLGCVETFLALI